MAVRSGAGSSGVGNSWPGDCAAGRVAANAEALSADMQLQLATYAPRPASPRSVGARPGPGDSTVRSGHLNHAWRIGIAAASPPRCRRRGSPCGRAIATPITPMPRHRAAAGHLDPQAVGTITGTEGSSESLRGCSCAMQALQQGDGKRGRSQALAWKATPIQFHPEEVDSEPAYTSLS